MLQTGLIIAREKGLRNVGHAAYPSTTTTNMIKHKKGKPNATASRDKIWERIIHTKKRYPKSRTLVVQWTQKVDECMLGHYLFVVFQRVKYDIFGMKGLLYQFSFSQA